MITQFLSRIKTGTFKTIGLSFLVLTFSAPGSVSLARSKPPALSAPLLWGTALDGYPITGERLDKIENDTHLSPAIVVFFLQWPSTPHPAGFPKDSLNAILQRGAVPCITWEPMYYEDRAEKMIPYQDILNGKYDPYLSAFANQANTISQPFIIRFAHEMNIRRYHWGTSENDYGPKSPEVYQRIFRHVVNIFRRAGANHVLWAFCPNAESVPDTSYDPAAGWNHPAAYYPGDDYVDILGMDGYNWGTTQNEADHGWKSAWKPFKDIFSPAYRKLKAISSEKPLLIFETACADQGGSKNKWIADALDTLGQWQVQGLVWFQARKEIDWRINSSKNFSYVPRVKRSTSPALFWLKQAFKLPKSKAADQ